jgi:hypothetical protein
MQGGAGKIVGDGVNWRTGRPSSRRNQRASTRRQERRGGFRVTRVAHCATAFFADHERLISMKAAFYLATALLGATALHGGHAVAANVCRADPLVCPTTMPVDGFCQCKASGMTANGTVTDASAPSGHYNSSAGGCGSDPNDPGCHAVATQGYAMPAEPEVMPPPPPGMPTMPPPPPSMPPPPPGG